LLTLELALLAVALLLAFLLLTGLLLTGLLAGLRLAALLTLIGLLLLLAAAGSGLLALVSGLVVVFGLVVHVKSPLVPLYGGHGINALELGHIRAAVHNRGEARDPRAGPLIRAIRSYQAGV
jgi:hypothetical protein